MKAPTHVVVPRLGEAEPISGTRVGCWGGHGEHFCLTLWWQTNVCQGIGLTLGMQTGVAHHMWWCQGLERAFWRLGPWWGERGGLGEHFCLRVCCHPEVSAEAVASPVQGVCRGAWRGCHVAPFDSWHPGPSPRLAPRGWVEETGGRCHRQGVQCGCCCCSSQPCKQGEAGCA